MADRMRSDGAASERAALMQERAALMQEIGQYDSYIRDPALPDERKENVYKILSKSQANLEAISEQAFQTFQVNSFHSSAVTPPRPSAHDRFLSSQISNHSSASK